MSKEIELEGVGRVILTKRRTSRHIRLRIGHDGTPHVSLPFWVPYQEAVKFMEQKQEWIIKQREGRVSAVHENGQRIGKSHVLKIVHLDVNQPKTRITGNQAVVTVPLGSELYGPSVQKATERVILRALKLESEALLPQRLAFLAQKHGFAYNEVKVVKMRSRWGSCSSLKLITLNYYLIQLPWHIIDYVLLHELAHTQIMSHGKDFWALVETLTTDVKAKRKELKAYHTNIVS